jgi:uncharacterized protein (DUF2235 family)
METKSVKPRRIIVCLDGTWDTPSGTNSFPIPFRIAKRQSTERTNVYKFSQVLMDGDVVDSQGNLWEQVHTYFTGLGTSQYRMLGGLFGYGISGQIKSAYKYICKRYRDEKDQIWLLGFSRGGSCNINSVFI